MSPEARDHSFDELTRGLANDTLSRGKALRLMGAALVGGALASIPGIASAKPNKPAGAKCKHNHQCLSGQCVGGECGGGYSGLWAHNPCVAGDALEPDCDPCVSQVCAADSFCCTTRWDGFCAEQYTQFCPNTC